jgi:hypothetical protein
VITAKRNTVLTPLKDKIQRLGFLKAKTAQSEHTATNADTVWRLGMMGALGIFVHNKNTDKGNRR